MAGAYIHSLLACLLACFRDEVEQGSTATLPTNQPTHQPKLIHKNKKLHAYNRTGTTPSSFLLSFFEHES